MALKLALPMPDKAKLALAGARLRAWWNGEPPPSLELVPAALDENGQPIAPVEGEVPSLSPAEQAKVALQAGEVLWGEGRTLPGNEDFDVLIGSSAGATKDRRVYIFEETTGALAESLITKAACRADVWSANPAAIGLHGSYMKNTKWGKRCTTHAFDWKPGSLPKAKADAAIFAFQGENLARLEAGAFCIERILRAGSSALWIDMFARADDDTLNDARGPEARSFATESAFTDAVAAAGLLIRADDDWGAKFLDIFATQWRLLSSEWDKRQALLIKTGGIHAASSAYEQALAWKARAEAIRSGRLTVRRYIVSRAE